MILADYGADFHALSSRHEALIKKGEDLLDAYRLNMLVRQLSLLALSLLILYGGVFSSEACGQQPNPAGGPVNDNTQVTDKGVRHDRTLGPYRVLSGYEGYIPPQHFLIVRDKASQEVLLEVKPGEFPAAKVPYALSFWEIQGNLCVYGALKDGQGAVRAFDLSARRLAYEIPADALGPGELDGIQFLSGRLYLSGNVQYEQGWVQLRQAENGQIIWKLDPKDLPGWVSQVILVGKRLVMCGKDGWEHAWIEARNFDKGEKLWSALPEQHDYPPTIQSAGTDRVVVLTYQLGEGTRICCLDAENGKATWKVAVKPTLTDLVVQKDVVLAQTEKRSVAVDLPTGRILSDTVYEVKEADGTRTPRPAGTLSGTFTDQERKEMEALRAVGENPAARAMGWTMIHCATEAGQARAHKLFETMEAYEEEDIVGFRAGGGAKGILDSLQQMLDDPDPVMRAFAAVALASAGQHGAVEKIAKLMKSPSVPAAELDDVDISVFGDIDRGLAAVALGILGAKEYADDMSAMLSDKNSNVRAGAASGLGYLKASQHAKAVSMLLDDEDDKVKVCAMDALGMMDARTFARDIVNLVDADGDPSVAETACFTLAQLGAMEQAPRIAALLENDVKRGYAARALAVLGAHQYAADIAKLLKSTSSLDRKDACLALGLLNAKEHEKAISEHMTDPETFVCSAAAFALVLLNSTQYASQIIPIFEETGCFGLSDLRLPKDRQKQVEAAAKKNFEAMKVLTSAIPAAP